LKPVSAFTVRAFVELAEKTWELRQQAREAETLRLDRDALLQYVLEVNLKLQEYDQERSNFLARAIHDFRAPLTALHGYCGLLAEGKLGAVNAGQRELLERMRYSTRRLTRLAGGTLELLTHGRVNRMPDRRQSDIEDALDQALHDVYPFLQDKQIEIDVQIEPMRGSLLFEEEQIAQVLMNLLENSSKFTPKDGRIVVRGYPVRRGASTRGDEAAPESQVRIGDGYRMDIFDTGPGVSPHLCEKIFEQYTSYGGPNDRSGGGLGLAICRAIILAHGGAIWAAPSEEGGRFSFVLPAAIAAVQSESTAYSSLQLA
jgi:signal transduction histidine kinase